MMNTKAYQMQVSGIPVDVVKKDIRNIHLAVYPPTGRVRVSSPLATRDETLRLFIIDKLGWIKKHIRLMDKQAREPEREYIQGESHWIGGKRYLLNIIRRQAPPRVAIRNNTYIDLYIRPGSSKAKRREVMLEWQREVLKAKIPAYVATWQQKLGVELTGWSVRQMKTKWGSCNIEARRLLLNLQLAKKPDRCLEYIIVHEMMHLLERHHNSRFMALMSRHLPGWKQLRQELNAMPVEYVEWGK